MIRERMIQRYRLNQYPMGYRLRLLEYCTYIVLILRLVPSTDVSGSVEPLTVPTVAQTPSRICHGTTAKECTFVPILHPLSGSLTVSPARLLTWSASSSTISYPPLTKTNTPPALAP